MKTAFVIAAIATSIIAIAAFLFDGRIRKANRSVNSVCQTYSIGQKIDMAAEIRRIESHGLHITTAVAGEVGHNVQSMIITASGFEPAICEVQIRDGSIFSIK